MAMSPTLPNLTALLGREVAERLVSSAGGLSSLSKLSDGALRRVGDGDASLSPFACQLHSGHLATAPVLAEYFPPNAAPAAALKALSLLARKCSLAARADFGGSSDASMGQSALEAVRRGCARIRAEGCVHAVDTTALPVPQMPTRGEAAKRRGGRALFRRDRAQREEVGAVERAVARVRMGVSEEEQLRDLAQRGDVRAELMAAARPNEAKRKRKREEDEYDDLLQIRL